MSHLHDEVLKLSESEALDLFYELRAHHGWQGSVWGEADIEDLWEEIRRPDFGDGYGPDIAKPWHEVRENVLAGRSYTRWFTEYLVEKGNEYLSDWILELNDEGNEVTYEDHR